MGLSRDVELTTLSCTVCSLEGDKVDQLFSGIYVNISKTV